MRKSYTFNSTIFSLWHYRFDLCQTIQITKCIPPIALAEGRVAETSLGKILPLPRSGGSESELLSLTLPRFCCGIDNRQVFTLWSKKYYNFSKKVTIYPQFVKKSRKYAPIIECRECDLRNFVVESSSVPGLGGGVKGKLIFAMPVFFLSCVTATRPLHSNVVQ